VSEGGLTAEDEQVGLGAGPITIVVVAGPVETGWLSGLTTVSALQGGDQ